MKQVMNYNKDNGLLNMIRRTDPMIVKMITEPSPGQNSVNQEPGPVIVRIAAIIPTDGLIQIADMRHLHGN